MKVTRTQNQSRILLFTELPDDLKGLDTNNQTKLYFVYMENTHSPEKMGALDNVIIPAIISAVNRETGFRKEWEQEVETRKYYKTELENVRAQLALTEKELDGVQTQLMIAEQDIAWLKDKA